MGGAQRAEQEKEDRHGAAVKGPGGARRWSPVAGVAGEAAGPIEIELLPGLLQQRVSGG